jgi:hypothetical protein
MHGLPRQTSVYSQHTDSYGDCRLDETKPNETKRNQTKRNQQAMNRFWDLLEGTPGIRAHRPAAGEGSTMGGWYTARGIYMPDELGGLPLSKFLEALKAEGFASSVGANDPLHLHPLMNDVDVYGAPKRSFKAIFIRQNERFTKTGSGQTYRRESTQQQTAVFSLRRWQADACGLR